MAQKFNSDLEIPKYLKQKESNISKAIKKSKHKHQYEECLLRYAWKQKKSFMFEEAEMHLAERGR